jgi:MFS family permease
MVPQAVALSSLGTNVSRAVGPALGGLVIAAAGPPWVFLANALSVVGVALVVGRWRGEARSSKYPPEHLAQAIRAGIRYARSSRELRTVIIRSICFFICASALWSFLPLVAKQQLGAGATGFGLLITFIGAGAILGGLLMSRLRATIGANRLSIGATFVVALSIVMLALAKSLPVAFACCFAAGVGWITMVSSLMSSTQLNAAGWVKARSLGIFISIFQGSMAIGATVWGMLASYAGIQVALVTAAALLAGGTLAGLIWQLKIDPGLDLTPSNHWPSPITDSSIPGDSGPVLITIEYQINPATAEDFLRQLAAMREIRLRDGAMRWGHWRDTSNPNRVVETFVVPSWLEHLRQHDRVTNADRVLQDRLKAFHVGESEPLVRHWIALY